MSDDFEEVFGRVVGQGAQATVYAKGDYAVKLYREDYPKVNVFSEAYIMANLERENFPCPKVYEVLCVNGRYGLRMERVNGKMMSEDLAVPEKFKETLKTLVKLQCNFQKNGNAAEWVPDLKIRLYNDLMRNDSLAAEIKKTLSEILAGLPDGQALCHCDFHAGNVFFDGTDYKIIDLLQLCKGDPAADAACSYVSYAFIDLELAEYYLECYCDMSSIPRENVMRWLPVYAGTLLGQLPEEYLPLTEQFINMCEKTE